ncbi:MAG: hypothetical protein C5B54_11335 [Acidobacteria bacterium]|nr:MAG: hypothetical protein C5B54_11335 [Acidobacteriota bacterium]
MDPEKPTSDGHDGWEYAGEPDFSWKTFHEWNGKTHEKSMFEYNGDPPEIGPRHFSEPGYQEIPDKE